MCRGAARGRPPRAKETTIEWPDVPALPTAMCTEHVLTVDDPALYGIADAVASLLRSLPAMGRFPSSGASLQDFEASSEVFTNFGTRRALYEAAGNDSQLLACYERLMREVVLPSLTRRLAEAGDDSAAFTYWYQCPPTVRVQPADPHTPGRVHCDADYGHQLGELNFWMPLTPLAATNTTLWLESSKGSDDFHPLQVDVGEIACFHGTLCRHKVPPNASASTRVSLDFRVGVGRHFDPEWKLPTAKAQHTRRRCTVEAASCRSERVMPPVAAPAADESASAAADERAAAAGESAPPTDAEIALATDVLRRMGSGDLDAHPDLLAAGSALFRRHCVTAAFGTPDVVAHLKQQSAQRAALKELRRLHAHIQAEHEAARKRAASCGINAARWETLELIKAECTSMEAEGGGDGTSALMAPVGFERSSSPEQRCSREVPPIAAPAAESDEADAADITAAAEELLRRPPPRGDFTVQCNICRGEYLASERDAFYHQLCPRCAAFNLSKREQTADLSGRVCVVTGARVRIGYATTLKLLRAGALVLATTRFPYDAAQRYSREADVDEWRDRLEIFGPLELANIRAVERFCDMVRDRFGRIHILINNAAQTLTRAPGWFTRQQQLEERAAKGLNEADRALLSSHAECLCDASSEGNARAGGEAQARLKTNVSAVSIAAEEAAPEPEAAVSEAAGVWLEASNLRHFPPCRLDESRQPLDLSPSNSWSRRLGEVPTLEMLQTLAANAAAPFVLVSRLAPLLGAAEGEERCGHIINVSAVEGKFSVPKKSAVHPHTNMGKAALNMMTYTGASSFYQQHRILMNCVDTGWVTDMAPGGVGVVASTHETWVATPLDEVDGAARVLDPIFSHEKDTAGWLVRGRFFRNYFVANW